MSTSSSSQSEPSRAELTSLTVSARAAEKLRRGGIFVKRDEVLGASPRGDVVRLRDERGRELGSATWAAHGPIAARLFDRGDCDLSTEILAQRIAAAESRRLALYKDLTPARDAFRLVHGEADLLPGLFIDRYADAAVLQTTTAAMDARKSLVAKLLIDSGRAQRVIVRDDGSGRDLEELPRVREVLLDQNGAGARVRFHDAGSLMEADLLTDRKTGSFLDQQENHAAVADYAARMFERGKARALDCFTYHGGFALALARAGLSVMACDEDPEAVARARHNATQNAVRVDFRVDNAFDLLRRLESTGARFEVVVIDPPALAKRGRGRSGLEKKNADSAWERAYKELNLRALRLLSPGGLLCTCSCSGRVSLNDFAGLVESAARDVGRTVQILERRGAGRDHPALIGWPESEYLKCWLLQILN